jgi:hypothetical protein
LLGGGAGLFERTPTAAPAIGGGPEGAGPGEAGKSSVHAGLAGTPSDEALRLGGAGRSWVGGGVDFIDDATAVGAMAAAAIAGAGLAKSVLGWVECKGEAAGGESGILACVASSAALFPKGFAEGGPDWRGSLNGLSAGATFAAPGRSQALLGWSGRSRSLDGVGGGPDAAATPSWLPPFLLFSKAGSNWVTGLKLRRGAVDMVR